MVPLIVLLILIAMLLCIIEVLTPTLGILGVTAALALAGAVWAGFAIGPVVGWAMLVLVLVLSPIYVVVMIKWLPNSALGRRVFLQSVKASVGAAAPDSEKLAGMVGRKGVVETQLRPAGTIRVGGERIIARAESGVIDKGREVKIVGSMGMDVVVRQIIDN